MVKVNKVNRLERNMGRCVYQNLLTHQNKLVTDFHSVTAQYLHLYTNDIAPEKRGIWIIFFWSLHENACCGYSLEALRLSASNKYHNICFMKTREEYQYFSADKKHVIWINVDASSSIQLLLMDHATLKYFCLLFFLFQPKSNGIICHLLPEDILSTFHQKCLAEAYSF